MTSGFVPCCLVTCQPSCDQKITPLELSKWLFYFLLYLFFHTWIIIYDNLGTNLGTNIKHVSTVRWTVGLFLQLYIFYLYGKLDLPERLPFLRATTCKIFPTAIKSNKPIISQRHFIREQRGFLLI